MIRCFLILLPLLVAGCSDKPPEAGAEPVPVLDFPALKQSVYDPESGALSFPEPLDSLDGQQIAIAGFMAPYDFLDDMSTFMLMPSYVGCYFCKPPALNQVLYVEQKKSDPEDKPQFIEEPIQVTGTLRLARVGSDHPGHRAEFVYALDDTSIEVLRGEGALERARAVHTQSGKQNPAHDSMTGPASSGGQAP